MLETAIITPLPSSALRGFVESLSGQQIQNCYQCGKCTAGCPSAYAMDLGPRQIMRAIQLGLEEEILRSSTIWLCISCQTCSARCPREIDIARVMESLRVLAIARGTRPAEREVGLFHRLFLRLVKRWGRMYELGLGASYNLLSGHPLANMSIFPQMLLKGKLRLLPSRPRGASEVRAIFDRAETERAAWLKEK